MAPNYVTITETYDDGSGSPLSGTVTFTPSQTVYAAGVPLVTPSKPIVAQVIGGALKSPTGGTLQLLATDNTGLTFEGLTGFFYWNVADGVGGQSFAFFLPHTPSTVDLYSLASSPAGGAIYLPLAGGTMTGWLAPAVVALTFGATISVNAALGNVFAVTLTASTGTIANPTNPVDGQVIRIRVTQDGTGSRTVAWGSAYDWGSTGGTANSAPTLTAGASKTDIIGFEYVAALTKWVSLGATFPQGY